MKLKLALQRDSGMVTDVVVTADATATVGDIADALHTADPAGTPGRTADLTLQVEGTGVSRVLRPDAVLHESGLRSGFTVRPVPAILADEADRGPGAAIVRVASGPDAGREFTVPLGVSYVGRDRGADVRLNDSLVSKRHARITVDSAITITDMRSANGLYLSGRRFSSAIVTPADLIQAGETTFAIVPLQQAGSRGQSSPVVEFSRSPRVVARFEAPKVATPEPPQPQRPSRFPYLAMIAPLLMGAIMFALTRSMLSVIFVALSPLLMIGTFIDTRVSARREYRDASAQFAASVRETYDTITALHDEERAALMDQHPATHEAVAAAARLAPLLWTRRPEHAEFGSVRLGLGTIASALAMELPAENRTRPEHWRELANLEAYCRWLSGAPVAANLRECGALGLAGEPGRLTPVACGIVAQLASLHSPADLVLTAFVSGHSRSSWEWLTWLPHTGSVHSPLTGEHLAATQAGAAALLEQLEDLVAERSEEATRATGGAQGGEADGAGGALPLIVTVVEDDAPADRARLTRLAERGAAVGIHLIWVAASTASLPGACRSYLAFDQSGQALAGDVRSGSITQPVECEGIDSFDAMELARTLAPVIDVGAPVDDSSDLPVSLSYLAVAGSEIAEDAGAVIGGWQANNSIADRDGGPGPARPAGQLRAVIGQKATGPFALDLREHGPHALVGGTTGSGKSEFLQSWIIGMASAQSPDRVTFLLVDYKGGTAFAECVNLPHCVGLVTDLSPHLVRRALDSLRAELRRREEILNRKGAKDLVKLEASGDPECPPALVIVVDEFAALAQEIPEFVDGVVDVAQRGRSLGLHLVLATQRPAGVIRENLRANTNLRVALRMNDDDDSADILGTPMAAAFDPAVPGRGAARMGPGRIVPFQTGYVGGRTTKEPPRARIEITEMDFGAGRAWDVPVAGVGEETQAQPTDIARIVATLTTAARRAKIPAPRRPWLAPLGGVYDFSDERFTYRRTDEQLFLGVLDVPEEQRQPEFFFYPDKDGNLAIFGTGGTGKSTALRTLAVAAAMTRRGGNCHVYGLDFAGGGLSMLEQLPHVGAIVPGEDTERVGRLLRTLRATIDERSARYARAHADTIVEYRKNSGESGEPRIVLLVDGIAAFREAYEFTSADSLFTLFQQIAAEGRGAGVHVVVAGDRPTALPPSLSSTVQKRILLRLASEDDYMLAGEPKDVLGADSPPGRAVIGGHELQIAVLGGDANVAIQARELADLAGAMQRRGFEPAPGIAAVPERVTLADLAPQDGSIPVGMGVLDLDTLSVAPSGAFMVAGPPGSGRSTALAALAVGAREALPGCEIIHIAPRRSALSALEAVDQSVIGAASVAEFARQCTAAIEQGAAPVILLESVTDFTASEAEAPLDELVRVAAREGAFVAGEAETSTWSQAWTLAAPFKASRRGLLLSPGDTDGDALLGTPLGRFRRADLPPGRGFLVAGGKAALCQVLVP